LSQRTVADWFDTSCFTGALLAADQLKGICRFGNSGRGILEGPRMANIDLGLLKDFQATEHMRLQFRAEFFKAFNPAHFNPDGVVTNLSAGNLGHVISQASPATFNSL